MNNEIEKARELNAQLEHLRKCFNEAASTDPKVIDDYAWTIVKVLLSNAESVDPKRARQLLADCMRLPYQRPSKLHSALLSAGIKVSEQTNDLHFIPFLNIWNLRNFRSEDHERQANNREPSHPFPSLADRGVRRYALSRLLRPEEQLPEEQLAIIKPELEKSGYLPMQQMLVTRLKSAMSKEGRKLLFVTLTSADGTEVECVSSQLKPNPLRVDVRSVRHYVNIGQLYDVIPRMTQKKMDDGVGETMSIVGAFLSAKRAEEVFDVETGYVEAIDAQHEHIHVYDRHSRHFVAHVLRFSREQVGDFVQFIPVVPKTSKFKTAIITKKTTTPQPSADGIVRTIRITDINEERHFASWQLVDATTPIAELLSPLQISQGETSPSFTSGYLSLTMPLTVGGTYNAVVYLRRGKDGQKRPYVARVW